jgi:hypothetical protein
MYDGIVHCRACVGSGKIVRPPSVAGPTAPPTFVYAPPLPPRGPHITSGTRVLLYLLSVIPILGIIIGLIYAAAADRESRNVGGNCLVIGIVTTVVGCLCWMFAGYGSFLFF